MTTADEIVAAIERGDSERVRELLHRAPELVNARTERSQTPVLAAVYHGRGDILSLLLSKGAELDLFEAAAVGDVWRIGEILDMGGADVNGWSRDGWTPLHLAAFFDGAGAAAALLARGADLDARSRNEMANTPLHAAVAGRRDDVVALFLARGADPNASAAGWTPLHGAAGNGALGIAEGLLGSGADPEAPGPKGETALDLALARGHHEVAELLRRHGAAPRRA
jgi:ankyrin repeat protein